MSTDGEQFRIFVEAAGLLPQAVLVTHFTSAIGNAVPEPNDLRDIVLADNLAWFLTNRDTLRRQVAARSRVTVEPIIEGSGPTQVMHFVINTPEHDRAPWFITMVQRREVGDLLALNYANWRVSHVGDPFDTDSLPGWE